MLFHIIVNSHSGRGNGFVNQPFGKNMVTEISHEVAKILGKPNQSDFTFNSFRRSSTSATPDTRALSPQFQENCKYNNKEAEFKEFKGTVHLFG